MQLPTPFLRGFKGVQMTISGDSLQILLPAVLRPKRRYCEVRVSVEPLTDSFLVEVVHQEVFKRATPGRNAWQTAYKREVIDLPSIFNLTALDRPIKSIIGKPVDLAFFEHRIQYGEPCTYKNIHVRITPEGFQFRVFRTAQLAAMPEAARSLETPEDFRRLVATIRQSSNHGGNGGLENDSMFIGSNGEFLTRAGQPVFSSHEFGTSAAVTGQLSMHDTHTYNCRCTVEPTEIERLRKFMTSVSEWTDALSLQSKFRQGAFATKLRHALLEGRCIGEIETFELNQNGDSEMNKIDNTTNATQPLSVAGRNIIRAVFEDGRGNKDYAYYSDDTSLAIGDFAVVVSPFGQLYDQACQGYITVVKVVSIEETVEAITKASKWIVQKIDLDGYRGRMAQIARVKLLDAKIVQAKKEAVHRLELQQLMALSPELANLIKERLELDGKAPGTPTSEEAVENQLANQDATAEERSALSAELATVTHLA